MSDLVVKSSTFLGKAFNFWCYETFAQHPSWFTFDDESDVRTALWGIIPGDWVLDIGAAYGSYTLCALSAGAAKTFSWALEGTPNELGEVELMRRSIDLNGWSDRATVFDSGMYSKVGWLNVLTQEFFDVKPVDATGPIFEVNTVDNWVETHQADLAGFNSRFWMKLDVEGAEVEVLKGAENFLKTVKPAVMVENHNFKRATLEKEVREFMLSHGYKEIVTLPYHSVSHSLYVPEG